MERVFVPLAEGFEEIEAITIIDVLRRAGVEVITAGVDKKEIKGAHGIIVTADRNLEEIHGYDFTGIVLPGGMPGAANLRDNDKILEIIKDINEESGLVAALCAAPIVLEEAGVLKDKRATSFPDFDKEMPSCNYQAEKIVQDGNIITSRGPGLALEFAIYLVEYLVSSSEAASLKEAMLANF